MSSSIEPGQLAPSLAQASPVRHMVVVGAGLAGLQAAETLRSGGFEGQITLIGDEPHPPYHRPPLSKAWLAGEVDAAQLAMRSPELLARKGIALRTDTPVRAVDRAKREVCLANGDRLVYDGLVLATGATARRLRLPNADAPGVLVLRGRDDANAVAGGFAHCLATGLPLVVIGGGFIGLEVAATARKKGLAATVLEAAPRLLARALAPMLSDWYAALHRAHGVDLRLGAQPVVIMLDANGRANGVQLADGSTLAAGLVVMGVGVGANDQLARDAGLACDRGIVVDDCGRTSDPFIVAAGDCTARRLPDGTLLRLESVHNATEQGRSAAAALLGQPRPFTATPWFWSDQYDRKLQMAGLSAGADAWVLRGDMAERSFSVWHYLAERLLAVDTVNSPKDHLLSRKLLDAGVSPSRAQAADTGFDLASLVPKPGA